MWGRIVQIVDPYMQVVQPVFDLLMYAMGCDVSLSSVQCSNCKNLCRTTRPPLAFNWRLCKPTAAHLRSSRLLQALAHIPLCVDSNQHSRELVPAQCAGMEGYLRPGCVHVTVQAIVDQDTHDTSMSGGIANVVRQLIARVFSLATSLSNNPRRTSRLRNNKRLPICMIPMDIATTYFAFVLAVGAHFAVCSARPWFRCQNPCAPPRPY